MLILSRRESESVIFPLSREVLQRMLSEHPNGCNLEVRLVKLRGSQAKLGVKAPENVPVMRNELMEAI